MVEYLSGNRIQGSSTLTSVPPQTSWKELGRTTLSSAQNTITVSNFTAKDNLMVLFYGTDEGSGQARPRIRFNSDDDNNYSFRETNNGSTGSGSASQSFISISESDIDDGGLCRVLIENEATKEKQVIVNNARTYASGTAPNRYESMGKWANTSNQITTIDVLAHHSVSSYKFASGSEVVVLGCDNDEADSGTNFWQELASVTLSSAGDDLDTGTFTAKKYLKIEFYSDGDGTGNAEVFPLIAFNNDTTQANYAVRRSNNFATDSTFDNSHGGYGLYLGWGGGNDPEQCTAYISNNSGNEKLYMGEMNIRGNVNAIGDFNQHAGKWKTTSGQITRINIRNGGGSQFSTNSYLKVWGAD